MKKQKPIVKYITYVANLESWIANFKDKASPAEIESVKNEINIYETFIKDLEECSI